MVANDGATFFDEMDLLEATRHEKYWTRYADVQGPPLTTRRHYTPEGSIKQVTTYDKFGNRQAQFVALGGKSI